MSRNDTFIIASTPSGEPGSASFHLSLLSYWLCVNAKVKTVCLKTFCLSHVFISVNSLIPQIYWLAARELRQCKLSSEAAISNQ